MALEHRIFYSQSARQITIAQGIFSPTAGPMAIGHRIFYAHSAGLMAYGHRIFYTHSASPMAIRHRLFHGRSARPMLSSKGYSQPDLLPMHNLDIFAGLRWSN